MDLINGVPRSGHDTVGGIVLLTRLIDKMRAHIAGTLGEHVSHRGFSADVFELFGTDAETFVEIAASNLEFVTWPATDPAALERMHGRMVNAGHGDRLDIVCALDQLDHDEGREVPIVGRHAAGLTHH